MFYPLQYFNDWRFLHPHTWHSDIWSSFYYSLKIQESLAQPSMNGCGRGFLFNIIFYRNCWNCGFFYFHPFKRIFHVTIKAKSWLFLWFASVMHSHTTPYTEYGVIYSKSYIHIPFCSEIKKPKLDDFRNKVIFPPKWRHFVVSLRSLP